MTLSATIEDANGHSIQLSEGGKPGLIVHWETSDSAVATVNGADGRKDQNTGASAKVTAVTAGIATITGRWSVGEGSVSGTATVTVTSN